MGKKRRKGEGNFPNPHNNDGEDAMSKALEVRLRAMGGGEQKKKRKNNELDDEFQVSSGISNVASMRATEPKKKAKPSFHADARTSSTTLSAITSASFAELPVSAATKKALSSVLKYDKMTVVQQQSIPPSLTGADVLAKARTGTGKTLAFCIPAVEAIAKLSPGKRHGAVSVLAISPTRELAQQIEAECKLLLQCHNGITVRSVVGGTNVNYSCFYYT